MVGEHFGISVGEAMAAGCVPVVHDSGGPREIVGEFGLFYSSVDECVKVVGEALQSSMDSCVIADRVRMFGADVFKKNFIELLEKKCLL
jgi:glycosyltransferase involved in cell wall biosynthesis